MEISGRLSEFSLAEVFRLLEQGRKSGLLTLRTTSDTVSQKIQNFYIWFQQGQIVAAANRLDSKGLVTMIHQRQWLGESSMELLKQAFQSEQPLGLQLKCLGVLQAEQLKLLFYAQVMRQMCALFQFQDGWFNFVAKTSLPHSEMTGLTASPTEVTLEGLRVLRDWRALVDQLPEATSAISSTIVGKPNLRINQLEWQVWEFANGTEPLTVIAEQLQLPIEKVQQIAFRLIVVGLIEEMPMLLAPTSSSAIGTPTDKLVAASSDRAISQSFLQNLMGFLNSKI